MLERLAQLDQNVSSLEMLRAENAPEAFGSSITLQWALRYGLIESIQIVIDTGRLYGFLAQLDIFRRYAKELRQYL
ncbi:MAG TPA: hypothetical protein PLH55_08350 [Spirochaetales bacterium]|nr:hypothetical protein [Spirochaetales bacterium]